MCLKGKEMCAENVLLSLNSSWDNMGRESIDFLSPDHMQVCEPSEHEGYVIG